MEGHPEVTDPAQADHAALAKAWLVRLIERTPLEEVGDLDVAWIADEAPQLIGDLLEGVARPEPPAELELDRGGRERLGRLAALRRGPASPGLIPRDLAVLQGLLIEALAADPENGAGGLAAVAGRLAELVGAIQGSVAETLSSQSAGGEARDPLTGLPGPAELESWIRFLLAEHRRYQHPFGVALIDVDGLGAINDAYGREAGDGVLSAVAGVVRRQVRDVDRAFRTGEGGYCVLAPHQGSGTLVPMGERLAELVSGSQLAEGPRLAIAVGIASCPDDGDTAEGLLGAAEQASFAAKAAGRAVAVAEDGGRPLQDR